MDAEPKSEAKRLTIYLPAGLYEKLGREAFRQSAPNNPVSASALLQQALREYLDRMETNR